ncbi:hypothetical protein HJC23_004776 [Cyclotella cryptica]|uniref:SET domain-containing protein n=1 Tax=Cyclotella cryptica TaxID=29204 RepID=A0ABD3PYN3_9STRA|eukprot:CCRYP_010388-RA/>CCRYP_010388-RA protein AED:0.03 eAED:0.03 QI:204/-1/1/1/-1/1/1/233/358
MDNKHQSYRPPRLFFYLVSLLLLQLVPPATPKVTTHNDDAYEFKMQEALKYYSENVESIMTSSHETGSAQIETDGETQLEFASAAVDNELRRLHLLQSRLMPLRYAIDAEDEEEEEAQIDYGDVEHEAYIKSMLDPDEWYRYSYWELHAYFSCAAEFIKSKPIPTNERWRDLRDYYHEFVKQDLEDWPLQEGMSPRSYVWTNESYDPPMEPFQSGYKGRGLKAARDIKEGELVFKATNNTIIFTHGHTWRKFLFALYEREGEEEDQLDSETTCDVLVWSWIQRLVPGGPLVIVMDLDNGSLMNEGREDEGWEDPNVKCGKDNWCDFEYYAIKDIKKGEEILCDYREFAMLNAWKNMGL